MIFSTPVFFVFFVIYFGLHFAVPRRHRLWLIVAGSTVFYAWWRVEYLWIPFVLMATAYLGGRWIDRAKEADRRWRHTAAAIAVLLLPLAIFKYTDFVYRDVFGPFFGIDHDLLNLPLPLGISFVSFTLTAYLVDIYREVFTGNHRPKTILAYVLFFPHLIAGPILRPYELISQLEDPRAATLRNFAAPLSIFTIGLVKEAGIRRPARADSHRELCAGHHGQCAGGAVGYHRLRGPGLLRLFGLYRHGDWTGRHARNKAAAKLPSALYGDVDQRPVAPLAHDPDALPQRLRLSAAVDDAGALRRAPQSRQMADVPVGRRCAGQRDVPGLGHLARRRLEFHRVRHLHRRCHDGRVFLAPRVDAEIAEGFCMAFDHARLPGQPVLFPRPQPGQGRRYDAGVGGRKLERA